MSKKPQADAKSRDNNKAHAEDKPAAGPKVEKIEAAKPKTPKAEPLGLGGRDGEAPKPAAAKAKAQKTDAIAPKAEEAEAREHEPDEYYVRERAYVIWIEEGQPHGRHEDHWHRARSELKRKPKPRS